jgi:hypothetical protein
MKKNLRTLGILAAGIITFASCTKDEGSTDVTPNTITPATAASFIAIKEQGIKSNLQNFTITTGAGYVTLTSKSGVKLNINPDALTKNGVAVTGDVKIEFIELFDKGRMLVTNKPTMGLMGDGNKSLLKSGGEFFIKATQGGVELKTTQPMNMMVPGNLTAKAPDSEMTFWEGDTTDAENLVWKRAVDTAPNGGKPGQVGIEGNNYYVSFGNFGWTNVDKFYSDPRPRTTILATAPAGYNNTNSAIYLSYDGEGNNALAKLDTYLTATSQFSEHYGQIPIGLKCHVIFATEDSGQWRYAIKAVTVAANDVYSFTLAETTLGTEAQLVAAINAIQ